MSGWHEWLQYSHPRSFSQTVKNYVLGGVKAYMQQEKDSLHSTHSKNSKQSALSTRTAQSARTKQSVRSAQSVHSEKAAQSAHSEEHRKKTQTTQTAEIDYVKAPIPKLYRRLLPSAIGSLLTATVASFIDVVILSHYLGPGMLAIVSLCMPIYMLVNTLSMLIASGASTLYAQYLGEGDKQEALRYFSVSVVH